MATLTLKIKLPDEVKNQLNALPRHLRLRIEDEAQARGLSGLGFFITLKAMLHIPKDRITLDSVERDILDEIWLVLAAFEESAPRQSGKRLDALAGVQKEEVQEDRILRFQQWAKNNDHNTPLLSDEAVSRDTIYGTR